MPGSFSDTEDAILKRGGTAADLQAQMEEAGFIRTRCAIRRRMHSIGAKLVPDSKHWFAAADACIGSGDVEDIQAALASIGSLRSKVAIQRRANRLGISIPYDRYLPWSEVELGIIRGYRGQHSILETQAELRRHGFERTVAAITRRLDMVDVRCDAVTAKRLTSDSVRTRWSEISGEDRSRINRARWGW